MITRFEQFSAAISTIYQSMAKIERMEMAKYGLKGPHAQCLLTMSLYPEGITAARLCEVCEKDKAAVSRTVAELESFGMILRVDPDGKRYRTNLILTDKGREVAQNVNDLVHLAVSQASAGYDTKKRETFTRVLNLIASNLQTICREGLHDEDDD